MENYIKTKANNRHDLLMELGKDEINERCKFCGSHTKKHLNRLHAEINKPLILIIAFLTLIFTVLLLFSNGYIFLVLFSIPIFMFFDQQKKASNFNKTLIK